MKISGDEALRNAFNTRSINRYPEEDDIARSHDGLLFPEIRPSFKLEPGSKVFTVGSCFARNIEEDLSPYFDLPTLRFRVPKSEYPNRPNGLLNEYNPACMSQRLLWAANKVDTSSFEKSFYGPDDNCVDLLLAAAIGVNKSRAIERRREIDAIYSEIAQSTSLVITLGLIECWYDLETKTYLNQTPAPMAIRANPERYRFEALDVTECFEYMKNGIEASLDSGVKNVLLTVSPVPLLTTFSGKDCVVANSYSKSVLRIVADMLATKFKGRLDYFPSYEIVLSGGLDAYSDHVHVLPSIVNRIVRYLNKSYMPA